MEKISAPIKIFFLFILFFSSSAISAEDKFTIYTSNYPLQYITSRITGMEAKVEFPIPKDTDPAQWQPNAETIVRFQAADLIILNGANYEHWLNKVSLPAKKVLNTSLGMEQQLIGIEDEVTHSHGMRGEHTHDKTASFIWLDFSQAIQQAESILQSLVERFPQRESNFVQNFEALKQDISLLDIEMKNLVANNQDLPLLASHPIYQYMQRRYGLDIENMHWEPDKYPDEYEWNNLGKLLTGHLARWMLWEDVPLDETAERLGMMGVKSLVFNPCENAPREGDFLTVMKQNIKNLEQAFK